MVLLSHLFSSYFLAQVYGSGAYGSLAYGSGVIQIGPFTLPDTGATWLGLASVIAIALGVGILVWLHGRRKKERRTSPQ